MRRRLVYSLALLFAVASIAGVASFGVNANSVKGVAIGEVVPDFKAADLNGTPASLSSVKGKNGTVLIFVSVQCPVSNAYNERMEKLALDYKDKGINVVGIYPNATESLDAIKNHVAEAKFSFTILRDEGNKVADQLNASFTPEVYVVDAGGKLVYHGRIDNQKDPDKVSSNDLRAALDEVLAGRPVQKPTAAAFGCTIKRAKA